MGMITEQIEKTETETKTLLPQDIGTDYTFKRKIVWFNAIGFLMLHLMAVYGIYRGCKSKFLTIVWALVVAILSSLGVTLGAHRLYTHKAFKATFVVRLAVIILHTIAGQNSLYIWVRDHRLHHKYSDTDADPHNASRGFFFSHMGWLMSRKHPAVIAKSKTIDLSDLEADPLVMFQKKHFKFLYVVLAIVLPIAAPIYLWNETFINSLFVCYFVRYIIQLHGIWSINSVAHMYGNKPYDKNISPVDSTFVSLYGLGEAWHNYHHTFPSDYRIAEYGLRYSMATFIIDVLAHFGLVYDLKEVTVEAVKRQALKKGDGTHPIYKNFKDVNGNLVQKQTTDST